MRNRASLGMLIMLASVALIGAVVALRVTQAQNVRYTISATPDKVLESSGGNSVSIAVQGAVSSIHPRPGQSKMLEM